MHGRPTSAAVAAATPCHDVRLGLAILKVCLLLAAASSMVRADEQPAVALESAEAQESMKTAAPTNAPSPWLLLPTFSNNPKLGTSFGGLAGYARKFDPESQVSLFGVSAQYTSTNSTV